MIYIDGKGKRAIKDYIAAYTPDTKEHKEKLAGNTSPSSLICRKYHHD
jgi:hypothetical protein